MEDQKTKFFLPQNIGYGLLDKTSVIQRDNETWASYYANGQKVYDLHVNGKAILYDVVNGETIATIQGPSIPEAFEQTFRYEHLKTDPRFAEIKKALYRQGHIHLDLRGLDRQSQVRFPSGAFFKIYLLITPNNKPVVDEFIHKCRFDHNFHLGYEKKVECNLIRKYNDIETGVKDVEVAVFISSLARLEENVQKIYNTAGLIDHNARVKLVISCENTDFIKSQHVFVNCEFDGCEGYALYKKAVDNEQFTEYLRKFNKAFELSVRIMA